MSLLETVLNESEPSPPKLFIYGAPGVGKTSLAAAAGALLVDCENGAGNIPGLARTPYLATWPVIKRWLDAIAADNSGKYRAVAIDTMDWLVRRIIEHVCIDLDPSTKKGNPLLNTIGSAHGGYFKARDIVENLINRELIPVLNEIAKTRTLILLGHAVSQKLTTPEGFDTRLASPDLPKEILPYFVEWADAVIYYAIDANGATVRRTMYTTTTSNVLAKNRYGLEPVIQDAHWPALKKAIMASIEAQALPEAGEAEADALAQLGEGDGADGYDGDMPDREELVGR